MQDLPDSPGAYVLILKLPRSDTVDIGALGDTQLVAASYAYVGSAMGGLSRRVRRYARPVSRPRWHVDYLLPYARCVTLLTPESTERIECRIASALAASISSVPSFGCSDCTCASHLFFAPTPEAMIAAASRAIRRTGSEPKLYLRSLLQQTGEG